MTGRLKQDRARLHTGHWQTAAEQTVTTEQLCVTLHVSVIATDCSQ